METITFYLKQQHVHPKLYPIKLHVLIVEAILSVLTTKLFEELFELMTES